MKEIPRQYVRQYSLTIFFLSRNTFLTRLTAVKEIQLGSELSLELNFSF